MGFSKFNRPKRPGSYTRFVAKLQERIIPVQAETVLVPFVHNWGPFKQVVPLNSYDEFLSIFGDADGPGKIAVQQAFKGADLEGELGAGTVLAYRFGATGAAKSTRIIQNTTPATALTLTARYQGTRGDSLRVTVQTNAADVTKKDLIIKDGADVLETFTVLATDATAFAAAINDPSSGSDWVTAAVGTSGVALANVADSPFSGGNDGATLVAQDWTDVMAAVEPERFAVLAPFDLTDGAILASLKTWAKELNEPSSGQAKTKRFEVAVGGGASDTIATAITRSGTLNSPYFVNLGVGIYTDEVLGDLTTSQLAPRIAGILANRGDQASISFARLRGLSFKSGAPTDADILKALDNGVLVIGRDSAVPESPLRLEAARTSYTDNTPTLPNKIYRNPKFLITMGSFETEINEIYARDVIGKLPAASKDTREFVLGEARRIVADRVTRGVLNASPAPQVEIDTDPPPTPTDEFVALAYEWTFGRSTEQVFNSVVVQ